MSKMWIKSVKTTSGFLGKAGEITFGPGLNLILGPKGCFKSTIVEMIRVALGVDETRIEELLAPDGRITKALGSGFVECKVDIDGDVVTVTRGVDGPMKVSKRGARFDGVEVFSQGDIKTLAEQPERRLELVDQAHHPKKVELLERRNDVAARLTAVGQRLLPVLRQILEKEAEVNAGPDAKAQLDELLADPNRPKRPQTLADERDAHVEREGLLAQGRDLVQLREQVIATFRDLCEQGRGFKAGADAFAKYAQKHGERANAAAEFSALLQRTADALTRAEEWCDKQLPGEPAFEKVERAFKEQDRPFERLLEQEAAHKAFIASEKGFQAVLDKAARAQAELVGLKRSEEKIRAERKKLYEEIDRIEGELRGLREERVRELERLSKHTSVAHIARAKTEDFAAALAGFFGNHLATLRAAVVAALTPRQLIDVVERNDTQALIQLRAKANDAARFIKTIADSTQFHLRLERVVLEDEIEITFKHGPLNKAIEKLSEGQRATALLPVLLQPDRPAPIVIDEPEPHLDNRFIKQTLVNLVKKLKGQRQVIMVTHNPNLATLTDPDNIIVMDATGPEEAAVPVIGPFKLTKHEVVRIVEGGQRAFREREQHYDIPPLDELPEDDEPDDDEDGKWIDLTGEGEGEEAEQ